MNDRRLLMLALGASLAGRAVLLRAQPSSSSMRRVGVLVPSTRAKDDVTIKSFYDEMRELGWIEGRNVVYDRVHANDELEVLPRLAAELVARKPDVIAAAPQTAVVAAARATQTIPIVFAAVPDPVKSGLVASLARPGGNLTGIASAFEPLGLKRIELLLQILPHATRIGLLGEPESLPKEVTAWLAAQLAAQGLSLFVVEAANPAELESAVGRLGDQRVDAILNGSVLASNLRARVIALTNARRLPFFGGSSQLAEAGVLFSYGASTAAIHRRQAQLVDQVLRGIHPADIPVEQPTQFELVVNLKTAKLLGITVPQSILLRADRVIK